MLNIGDSVRVLAPFSASFPDTYVIEDILPNGNIVICGDREFTTEYLEKV